MISKKKIFQRISIFMAGIVCFSTVSMPLNVRAEALEQSSEIKVHVAEDFEAYAGLGKPPSGFELTGGAAVKATTGARNDKWTEPNGTSVALRIEESVAGSVDVGVAKRFGADNLTGDIIVDLDIKMLDSNGTRFIEMQDSAKNGLTLANVTADSMKIEGKSSKIPLVKGEWNRVSFALHFSEDPAKHTVTVYVNGEEKLSSYPFENKKQVAGLNYLRIREKRVENPQEDMEGNKNYTTLIDNLRVYTGTELKTMEELKELNVPDSLLNFDNDLGISVDNRLAGSLAMVVNSRNVLFDNQKKANDVAEQNKPRKLDSQVSVPLSYVCKAFGGTVTVDPAGKSATVNVNGLSSVVTPEKVEAGGETVATSGILFTSDDVLIPLQAAGKVLKLPVYTDYKGRGLIVIGNGAAMFDDSKDVVDANIAPKKNEKFFIEEAIKEVVYDRSSGQEAIALLKSNAAAHPRIIATQADFDRIKQLLAQGDPNITKWYEDIKKQGEKHLEMPVVTNDLPDGRRMVGSRQVGPLVINLGMLYHLSGDEAKKEQYKQRIWTEVSTAAGFPDWNETNEFLNTAEFMEGLAIAYDWLYDEWTPEQRKLLEDAIIQKGLIKSLEAYNNNVWWIHTYPRANNWNAVCNGSTSLALMAIGDIDREIVLPSREKVSMEKFGAKLLDTAFNALEDFILLEFTPDGAWSEGPSYWKYTLEYLVKFMESLDTALGTSYGYDQTPGLDKTAYFPIYLSGAVGALNYGDASNNKVIAAEELWVAKKYGDKRLASIHLDNKLKYKNAGSEFEMLWYEPDSYLPNQKPDLDQYFSGTEVATFRSKWEDPNTSFLGFKAGNNVVSHGHYDLGSFVFEALGQQWAIDLGKDDYNLPGYSNYDKERLQYYRLNPEGHNTLVINPDGTAQQNIKAFSKIEKMESRSRGGFAIADLTEAYEGKVDSAKRGVMLSSNRTRATIQDEVTFTNPSQVYWFMHTEAEVEISEDGKSAVLTKGGEKLWVGLDGSVSDGDGQAVSAVLGVMDAKPLPQSPNPVKQNQNEGIRKLYVKLDNVKEMTLTVTMIPIIGTLEDTNKTVRVTPLAGWSISEGDLVIPVVDSVSLDGEPLEGFDSQVFGYDIELPLDRTEVPALTYTYDESLYQVQEVPAGSVPGTAKLIVTSLESPEIKSVYSFNYKLIPVSGEDANMTELPVTSVSASDAQADKGNTEDKAVDGDFKTYWGAEGDQWIMLDLGEERTVNSVGIAFIRGNERSFKFDIETSLDGENWYAAYSGTSSGESLELEKTYLRQHTARYIRITGHGNSTNLWNSYAEIRILQLASDKSGLGELLKQAEEYLKGEYTQTSLEALKTARDLAQGVFDKTQATIEEVNQAAEQLQAAIDALVSPADKTELEAAINNALELLKEEGKYTEESVQRLKAVCDEARLALDNPEATDSEIGEALKAIGDAVASLEEIIIIDNASLAGLITEAEGYQAKDYTQESYLVLQEAIAKAKAELDSAESTQERVEEAYQSLKKAVEELVKIGGEQEVDKTILEETIAAARKLDESQYTQESFAAVRAALELAEKALTSEQADQKEIDSAWKALQDAMNTLETKPDHTVSPGDPDTPDTPDTPDIPDIPDIPDQPDANEDNGGGYKEPEADWNQILSQVQDKVNDAVKNSAEGMTLNVITGRAIEVPAGVLERMNGQNMTAAFHTGHGITFSLTGHQITENARGKVMDLSIGEKAEEIPRDILTQKLAGSMDSKRISMISHAEFNMVVNLHLNMKKENAGRYANLYSYNSQTREMEYRGSFLITDNGQAMFGITKGADYLVTVTGQKPDEQMTGVHIVRKGDTLRRIAGMYNVRLSDLLASNPGLGNGSKIYPGETIRIK